MSLDWTLEVRLLPPQSKTGLITAAPQGALFGGGAGEDAVGFCFVLLVEWEAADGDFVLFGKIFLLLT